MPAQHLSLGVTTVIPQNVVHSLPWRLCYIQSSVAIESSVDGTTWAAINGVNTNGSICGASFIRCTTGPATVKADGY